MTTQTQNKKVGGAKVPVLRFPEFSGAWEETKLGSIGDVVMCKRVMKYQASSSGDVPFFKIGTFGRRPDAFIKQELYEDYKRRYPFPKEGAILISASGTIGRTVVYDGKPAYFQDSNIIWLDNSEHVITNNFLSYLYTKVKWPTASATIARLYNSAFKGIKVNTPSIPEQQKIADFLGVVDERIEGLSKKKASLERYKKGVMQKIFSQEIRFKDENGNLYLDWEEKKLDEVFEITAGKSKSVHITLTGEYIIVDMGGISSDGKFIAKKYTDHAKDFLTTNDLVMPKDDIGGGFIIGKVARIPEDGKYICGDHIFRLTKKSGDVGYLFYVINSFSISKSFRKKANGTAQLGLSKREVENQRIFFPSLPEQQKIAEFLMSLDEKISAIGNELSCAKEFKRGLLQQMFA